MLAAATAAVLLFGHIPAQGINPDPPREPIPPPPKVKGIEITHMGSYDPQTPNAVEWESHTAYVVTDRPFSRVDWYVDDAFKHTSRPDGASQTSSYFSHQYENGSTTGVAAVVKAVAYPRFHDPQLFTGDSEEMTITVWKAIGTMLYVPPKSVEGESIEIGLATTVPFDWVEYAFEGSEDNEVDPSNETSDTWSETNHTFDSGGDQDGNARTVTAVAAYVTPTGFVVKSRPETQSVKLYADNGYIWKTTTAEIVSIDATNMNEHEYILRTEHTVSYYNDTGEVQTEDIKTNLGWSEGLEPDKMGGWEGAAVFYDAQEESVFYTQAIIPRELSRTLVPRRCYSVMAYTNLVSDGNAQVGVDSGLGIEYDQDMNLPPTGQYKSKDNESDEADFLE